MSENNKKQNVIVFSVICFILFLVMINSLNKEDDDRKTIRSQKNEKTLNFLERETRATQTTKDELVMRYPIGDIQLLNIKDLLTEAEKNIYSFDSKYKGKKIAVQGHVAKVLEGKDGISISLVAKEGFLVSTLVPFVLNPIESEIEIALKVERGDKVIIIGKCRGIEKNSLFRVPEFEECSIGGIPKDLSNRNMDFIDLVKSRVLLFEDIVKEMRKNEFRTLLILSQSGNIRIKGKWDRVDEGDDGSPVMVATISDDFLNIMEIYCKLRMEEISKLRSGIDLSSEITVEGRYSGFNSILGVNKINLEQGKIIL